MAPIPEETEEKSVMWGARVDAINGGTYNSDNELVIWSNRRPKGNLLSRQACILFVKRELIYLGGEAWNMEPKCYAPYVDLNTVSNRFLNENLEVE